MTLIFPGIKCAAPVAPANSTVTVMDDNSTAVHAVATYECDPAYQRSPSVLSNVSQRKVNVLATLQPVVSYMHYLA